MRLSVSYLCVLAFDVHFGVAYIGFRSRSQHLAGDANRRGELLTQTAPTGEPRYDPS
jgi:hypothetical protein